jgi:hypothetical protein
VKRGRRVVLACALLPAIGAFAIAQLVACREAPTARPDLPTPAVPAAVAGGSTDAGLSDASLSAAAVALAAAKYPDLETLWARSISVTCGPNNGVCHNSRQYPDLQTSAGLALAVGKGCNPLRTSPGAIDNLCEPAGDLLALGAFTTRIGNVVPDVRDAPTRLTETLHDPVPESAGGAIAVVQRHPGLPDVRLTLPPAALVSAHGSSVVLDYAALSGVAAPPQSNGAGGSMPGTMATFLLPPTFVPGDETQVGLGDPNGDGVFGFDLGGGLVVPGAPLLSYLFLRVDGPLTLGAGNRLTNVAADPPATEPQMPIANVQFWDASTDLVALWCWIAGLRPDGANADGPIDYAHCSLAGMPAAQHQVGEAATFSDIFANVLRPACASCHVAGGTAPPSLVFDGDVHHAYDAVLGIGAPAPQDGALPFVTPADPSRSYLYLKLVGDPSIHGARMPPAAPLAADALDRIATWIRQGALDD